MQRVLIFIAMCSLLATGCSSWDHHDRIRRTCDVHSMSMDSGFDHNQSTPTTPLVLSDGAREYKWSVTDWTDPNQAASKSSEIIGQIYNGESALGNSKWISPPPILTDDGNSGTYETYSDNYVYSFCYANRQNTQDTDYEATGAPFIVSLELKTNAIINRVFHNETYFLPVAYPISPNPYSLFTYDDATMRQTIITTQELGVNCFNVHLIKPNSNNILEPLVLSAKGTLRSTSCLRTDY